MADLEVVAGRLNIAVQAGNTESVQLTWPANALDGTGPWTARVVFPDATLNLPVAVAGDVQTITLPSGTSDHLHDVGTFSLIDTATGNRVIGGTFRVTDQPGPATVTATVQLVDETVQVSVLADASVSSVNGQTGDVVLDAADVGADPAGSAADVQTALDTHEGETIQGGAHGGPLTATNVGADPAGSAAAVQANLDIHEAQLTSDVHGVRRFDWAVAGVGVLTENVINQDGAQAFTATVVDDRLRVTAATAAGNQRVAYELAGTDGLVDSEMRSLIWSPVGFPSAQQGHIHRVREISPGLWEGIAAWTGIFGADYASINTRGVRWTGGDPQGPPPASLGQSNGDPAASISTYVDRALRVRAYQRLLSTLNRYVVPVSQREWLRTLANGDLVTVTEMTDTSFNLASQAIASLEVAAGFVHVTDPDTSGDVAKTLTADGIITPGPSAQKRWTPYWLSSRVRGGTTTAGVVELKAWRMEEREPDWSDPRVLRRNISAPSATVPELAVGPGSCALWAAHLISTSQVSWGQVEARSLD